MTTEQDQTAATAVRRIITVDAPVVRAFEVFTAGFGSWCRWTTTPATRLLTRWFSSHASVAGGTSARQTAPNPIGALCWSGMRRGDWCWPGDSTPNGSTTLTRRSRPSQAVSLPECLWPTPR